MIASLLNNLRLFLIFLAAAIVITLVDSVGVLNLPKAAIQTITSPIQYGLYKTSLAFSKQFQFIFLARRMAQERVALNEQLALVLSENAQLRKKLAETQGFVEQQNTLSPQTYQLVPARPIGVSRFLFLDKGSNDGLKVGQAVVYKDNFIGKIQSVNPKKSQVILSTDPDSLLSAFSSNPSGKAKGILLGQYGSDMLLDKILHEEKIEVNDLVYSEGTEVEIPRGLILGQVSNVMQRDNEVFKQAKVKPVFDLSNLDIVFVITN